MAKQRPDEVPTELQERPRITAAPLAHLLTVLEGPDRGLVCKLDAELPSRVLLGTSPASTIKLTDPRVSRRHLAIDLNADRPRISDLESTNGTSINGVGVIEAWVSGGDLVRVGNTTLRIDPVADAQPAAVSTATSFGRLHGASLEMRRLYRACERLAASDVPVLIEGQTGTGKELLAEALHEASGRANRPFVVFDCTAVPANLLESELFGHERGAFTGAVATRAGVFEQADGGTLLIDEIGDLDTSLQPKLLRALERHEVRRVGGGWLKVDVRVLAATRRDLDREVSVGSFRDDLFYRLAVARIELPPLRERRGDVGFLTQLFWRELGGVGEAPYELVERFERYNWPGNARELRNAVVRQLAIGEAFDPKPSSSRVELTAGSGGADDAIDEVLRMGLPFPRARDRILVIFEKRYVERVLGEHGGVVSRAAVASGIARRYFNVLRARSRR